MSGSLFPITEYWWFYLAFSGLVVILLSIDLSFHRKPHALSLREAGLWTVLWMACALAFSVFLYFFVAGRHSPPVARQLTLEFLAGYLVEESLSVDNMFVFALVFRYFAVPSKYQHRVLFYGVLGALVFRAIFIGLGSALVRFHWVMIGFGLFLIYTGVRMALDKEKEIDPGHSPVIRWARRLLPVTPELHGGKFAIRRGRILHATPLFIVLLVLETTDIMFAVDSVPAVFGVTKEPLIVFTSNVFAILGLRAMYFLLSGAMDLFYALKYGLSVVLVFVGLKMVWLDHAFGGRFPIGVSLAIIAGVLAASVAVSLAFPQGRPVHVRALLARVAGATCLALGAASIAAAAGGLVPVAPVWLYVSAGCYAASGFVLIRKAGRWAR